MFPSFIRTYKVTVHNWQCSISTKANRAKQTTETNNSKLNITFKNPKWLETNQLAIYKRGRGFWPRDYRETNPGSGWSGTRNRDFWIVSPPRCMPPG